MINPGSNLGRLTALAGYKPNKTCNCKSTQQMMDMMGVEWCLANLDDLTRSIQLNAVNMNTIVPPRWIIRIAIRVACLPFWS